MGSFVTERLFFLLRPRVFPDGLLKDSTLAIGLAIGQEVGVTSEKK